MIVKLFARPEPGTPQPKRLSARLPRAQAAGGYLAATSSISTRAPGVGRLTWIAEREGRLG